MSCKRSVQTDAAAHIPHSVPQIFINLTPVTHVKPDVSLLGDADSIVTYLSHRLGWTIPPAPGHPDATTKVKIPPSDAMWLHGEGDWSHMHMLRSRSARENGADSEDDDDETEDEGRDEEGRQQEERGNVSPPSGDTTESGHGDEPIPDVERRADRLHITNDLLRPSASSTPDRRASASPAGSDRPTKRSRMGSMEDLGRH